MRIERVLAPNPGPLTGPGTNTYLVGDESGLVILDPGPRDASHRRAIEESVGGARVGAVLVTHTHPDHAPLANPLARSLGVPALGHAPGPEFDPDGLLREGEEVVAGSERMQVVHTPGHAAEHVCFLLGRTLFTGDHVMGGSSVVVEDMRAYLSSLEKVRRLRPARILPGHGPPVEEPEEVISWYLAHRLQREAEVLAAVREGDRSVGEVVARVYREVDPSLHPLAARSVAAHLRKLADEGRVRLGGGEGLGVEVELAEP